MDPIGNANLAPLSFAVSIGDDKTVLFLLETGANPEERDPEGRSALSLAVENRHLKSIGYLLEFGADPKAADGAGSSPVEIARNRGFEPELNLLIGAAAEVLREPARRRRRPIVRAPRRFTWPIVRNAALYLVAGGLAVGAFQLRSAFAGSSTQAVFDAIASNNESQISHLLTNGVSANTRDSGGESALEYAANNGRTGIVTLLLKNHADPNLGGKAGIARLRLGGIQHVEIVDALLDSGADPNRCEAGGRTLLAHACETGGHTEIIRLLLKYKANPNVEAENGSALTTLIEDGGDDGRAVSALLDAGADPNGKDAAGTPALVWAAEHGDTGTVKLLLAAHARVDAIDVSRRTALLAACRQLQLDTVTLLLGAGASVKARDAHGDTAVMYALSGAMDAGDDARRGCVQIVRLLVDHGAQLDIANDLGVSPEQMASRLGLPGIRGLSSRVR